MPTSDKLHPSLDADVPALYDENTGFAQRSKQNDQDHQQSGDLPPSSDPVKDGTPPFKIHYPA